MLHLLRPAWLLSIVLGLLVALDISYSFRQYYQEPLDGDLASIVLPNQAYQQVLTDPFGMGVALHGEKYPATNRFFAHAVLSVYFRNAPLLLQHVASPLDSVYLACAVFKTVTHLLLLALLAAYAVVPVGWSWRNYLIGLGLVTPLFHVNGYNMQMGLIDPSITYTGFYAWPSGLLLLFFLPFYRALWAGTGLRLHWLSGVLLAALAVVLAFNGPLVPGVVALVCPLVLGWLLRKKWRTLAGLGPLNRLRKAVQSIPAGLLGLFLLIGVLCVYSLFVGTYNSENQWQTLPVLDRYLRLPYGLYRQITPKLGIPLLLLLLLVNRYLLRRYAPSQTVHRLLWLLNWVGVFALAYLLLLPLGGYRSYRPNILRRDTVQPVLLVLLCFYGASSLYLLRSLPARPRQWYLLGLVVFVVFFTAADKPNTNKNACERQALELLAASPKKLVQLDSGCPVMQWDILRNPADSETNVQLLTHWRVLHDAGQRYYQPE